eukprot:525060-Prorocentrum_minimum.AAC.1
MWGSGPSFAAALKAEAPEVEERPADTLDALAKERPQIVVVDTNAIVKGIKLERLGDTAVTTQAVLDEIRDGKSRQILSTLPFGISVREPTEESILAASFTNNKCEFLFISILYLECESEGFARERVLRRQSNLALEVEPTSWSPIRVAGETMKAILYTYASPVRFFVECENQGFARERERACATASIHP